jgi:signal transduction histidine kinase
VHHIVITHGPHAGRRIDLVETTVVGRHTGCAVVLDDDRVSRRHCEFAVTPSGVTVADLGSGNGTRVNYQAISEPTLLRPGDVVEVGGTRLAFDPLPPSDQRFATRIIRSVAPADAAQVQVNLDVLYEAANVVSQVADTDAMLGRVLDLVQRATRADHAGALLIDPGTGELMPRVVRVAAAQGSEFAFSRTIVEHVRRENRGLLVSDAAADDRFAGRESVVRHRLRDVIAVPLAGRHDTLGVLVLDTLADAAGAFTADHLHLAVAVAHQAALALEEQRHFQRLMDAERLAAIGQTIAGMSHHIKNIMQGVQFGGDMVRTGLAQNDTPLLAQGWKLVQKNQARIDALIQDMLSYSKEREPCCEPTDMVKLIRDVLDCIAGRANDRGVLMTTVFDGEQLVIDCDPHGIHQAVLNVVSNAIDAVSDVAAPRVEVAVANAAAAVRLTVRDNGPGVPSSHREAIFQPFVSSKGARGTGLGLAVSRKALREHGGDLVVQDADGGGAEFVFTLPKA